jgi:MFS family permease
MRLLRNLLVGIITAVGSCFLAFPVADYITRLLEVSNFEGGRAYTVIFVGGGLGILVGLATGLLAGIFTKRDGLLGFLRAQGLSFLIIALLAGVITGIPWLLSDKPPRIDGKRLILDCELSVPSFIEIPAEPGGSAIQAILYTNSRTSRYGFIDWKGILKEPDRIMIPGRISLLAHSSSRILFMSVGNDHSGLFTLKLPPAPTERDEAWSEWFAPDKRIDAKPVSESEKFLLRCRVRPLLAPE